MHILFLSDNFPPEVNAPASRTFEHAREWVKAGHKVTVITCAPNFPRGEVFDGYRNRLWQSETMAGIQVIRVWSFITANEGFLKRILDYLSFMLSASIAALFVPRVDIIVGTSPQFFTAVAAFLVSLVKRRPWVFELRDIWPESIQAVGAMRQSRLLDLLERLELFLYRRATAIVAVTHAFRDNLMERGIDGAKIHVVTNGVDTSRFVPRGKDIDLVAKLGIEGKFVAGYIGTHGMAHALETILEAAGRLGARPDGDRFRFLFLGGGSGKAALMAEAQARGLANVIFIDTVPKDDVVRYWSLLDVSIIHLQRTPLFETVIPSKLFECMGMGIPVLHGVRGESARIVMEEKVGITFEPEDADDLCRALAALAADPAALQALRSNGPAAAVKYDRCVLAGTMLRILERMANVRAAV
ncbi:MAG: glycosyltransferase family 4 protein [Parvibaculum sp.]|uniref:glycosyltransferase family 4 protein n=1 Tax=Parvibaculum sp. TaxID=2024848 RepID=UPI0032EF7614